ncbi:MAG: response regulator transcription factor [Paracoccaceae bacterium]
MAIPRILVVEDDADMRQMLTQYLQQNGTIALPATGQADILKHFETGRVDLILLDVMLGEESGIEICIKLRQDHNVPIIMVSALSTDQQRMAGYEAGADDYISKPFNANLLMARIKAVLARTQRAASLSHRRKLTDFAFGGWTYNARTGELESPQGYQVSLSQRELALLQAFLANARIPLTREEIASLLETNEGTTGVNEVSGRAIDMLVGRLRSKIEDNPKHPQMLKTQRGVGYVFAVDVTSSKT